MTVYVDDRLFGETSRREEFREVDRTKRLGRYRLLQTDVVTILSSAIVVSRLFAGLWTGGMAWRCLFMLLQTSTISIREMDILLRWRILAGTSWLSGAATCRRPLRNRYLLLAFALAASFLCQFASPIMTGSIGWESSYQLVAGKVQIIDLPVPYDGPGFSNWKSYPKNPERIAEIHTWSATFYLDGNERGYMKHNAGLGAIGAIQNSILDMITIPYFAVKNLEWIRDPAAEIDRQLIERIFIRNASINPWNNPVDGAFGLVPDSWDLPIDGDLLRGIPNATVVSERRLMVGSPFTGSPTIPCDSARHGKTSGEVGFLRYQPDPDDPAWMCLVFAWVTYEAGAADCADCLAGLGYVGRKVSELTVKEDPFTQEVLPSMHWLTMEMVKLNYSTPLGFYDDLDDYAIELLRRSYAGVWSFLTTITSYRGENVSTGLATNVRVPTFGLRARVEDTRVVIWLVLNFLVTASGALFVCLQISSGRRLISKPAMMALAIDSSEVLHKGERGLCNFSYRTKEDDAIGYLWLEEDEMGQRKLKSGVRSRREEDSARVPVVP